MVLFGLLQFFIHFLFCFEGVFGCYSLLTFTFNLPYLLPAPRVTPPDEWVAPPAGADGRPMLPEGRLMLAEPAERVLPLIADGRLALGREGVVMLLFGVECDGVMLVDGREVPMFGRLPSPRLPLALPGPGLLPLFGRMPWPPLPGRSPFGRIPGPGLPGRLPLGRMPGPPLPGPPPTLPGRTPAGRPSKCGFGAIPPKKCPPR